MLQDIAPWIYNNDFTSAHPKPSDVVLVYRDTTVLVKCEGDILVPPAFESLGLDPQTVRSVFLFSVGATNFYLAQCSQDTLEAALTDAGFSFVPLAELVAYGPKALRFALTAGYEYFSWYEGAQYCGRCGAKMNHDANERMMRCPNCNNMVFPKLFPAVIVGITHPDGRVLVTRYKGRPYTTQALVAGFCELGETVEQTVAREVKEEVGINVKNLRFYKSQPWPLSSSLLIGFFCELDGSDELTVDNNELASAQWVERSQLLEDNDHSLTREMMRILKEGKERCS